MQHGVMGMWDVERRRFGVCSDGDVGCGVKETWDMECWGHGTWSDGDTGQELNMGHGMKEGVGHGVMGVWDVE